MSVDIRANGLLLGGVTDWSVQEESTPLDSSDTSGSVGGFSVTFDDPALPSRVVKNMRRKTITLDDLGQGRTVGRVDGPQGTESTATLSVQSKLTRFAVNRTMPPFVGTLAEAVEHYFGLVGMKSAEWFVDETIALNPVRLIGSYGQVWLQLKKLCAQQDIEVALVSDLVVVRPVRTRVAQVYRDSRRSYAIDDSQTAKRIQVTYYEPVTISPGDLTPIYGTAADYSAGSGGGGGVVEYD